MVLRSGLESEFEIENIQVLWMFLCFLLCLRLLIYLVGFELLGRRRRKKKIRERKEYGGEEKRGEK